jgi:hypothetical protein
MSVPAQPSQPQRLRIRVFVDFWNFSLSLRNADNSFRVDWNPIGQLLTIEAGKLVDATAHAVYEGMHVYGSIDPNKSQDVKLKHFLTNTLDKDAGRPCRRSGASEEKRVP